MTATIVGMVVLALIAAGALLVPVFRRPRAIAREDRELAVYRDQLAELDRDAARGLVTGEELAAARTEVERRILRTARRRRPEPDAVPNGPEERPPGTGRLVVIAAAVGAPVLAAVLYVGLGSPWLPDRPYAARAPAADPQLAQIRTMVAGLERRLAEQPDDVEGWLMLGRSKLVLGDAAAAVKAYRVAATRRPDDPHLWGNLGEALTLSAGGVVTPEAKSLLERLATSGAEDPRAEYYLGVAEAQAGDEHAAIERWRKLLAGSPADADWRPQVEEAVRRAGRALGIDAEAILASARGTAPPPPDDAARIAALPPDARDEQIRAMVARLEARLQERGGDAEGWQKLGRARRVLGEAEASRQAFAKAYTLAPDNPAVIADYAQSLLGPADPRTKMPAVSDDAAKLFERAAELQPDDPGPHWFMGIRALQQGQIVEARSQWSQVLALLGPNHPEYAGIKSLLDAIDAKAPAASTTGG